MKEILNMAKSMKTSTSNNGKQKVQTSNYGTHGENVVKISDVNINVINNDDIYGDDILVIAKDGDKKYVTVKRNIDSGLLDPYKSYMKDRFHITETIDEKDESKVSYTIKNMITNKFITIE